MSDDNRSFGALSVALLLGGFVCITFPGIIFGSHAFAYRDDGLFGYPVAYYFRQCFWQGHVPLWNPYNNCGIPFLAQWNTIVLYPLSLLYLVGPMPWSMNYFLIGHMFLAGIGMYFLALRWFGNRFAASVAAVGFAWNGLSINLLLWSCHIAALAWMPWVVLSIEQAAARGGRFLFLAALAGACQMMTGSPEIILFTWIIAPAACAVPCCNNGFSVTKTCFRFALIAAGVAALSAAQLLPWIDFAAHGDRSSAFDRGHWAMPLWGIGNFFVPLFRDNPSVQGVYWQPGQEMFSSYYAGIITVALGLVALLVARDRRTILLAGLAVVGLDCALGDAGLGLPLLKKIFPLLGFARYPVKFVVITIFCLPLLAAAGVARMQTHPAEARRGLWMAAGITVLITIGVVIVSRCFPFPGETWSVTWRSGWTRLMILLTAFVILLRQNSVRRLPGFALLLLLGIDICTHAPEQNPTVAIRAYDESPPAMSSLPKLGQSRAFVRPAVDLWMEHLANTSATALYAGHRAELFKNCNLLESIPKADGFFSLYLRRQDQIADSFARAYPTNLAEFLGVSQLASAKSFFQWDEQTNFMPWATIGQKPIFLDDAATLKAIASPEFRPREFVYLPAEAAEHVSASSDPQARILSDQTGAENCQYEIEAARPAMLVVAQTFYHCWTAQIDGQPAPVLRANYDFQAVPVPAGHHEVRLIYRDGWFHAGIGISLLSLAVCLKGALRRS